MRNITIVTIASVALALAVGCGSDTDDDSGPAVGATETSLQCDTSTYVAFDVANHANQDIRLDVHAQMNEAMSADADPADMFATAKDLYMDASASADLRAKVMGRLDQHIEGEPLQGERLDTTIIDWLDYGATTTDPTAAAVAQQWVDKSLTEFFYLSVHHELLEGSRKTWDEAFGYFGSGADNEEADLRGFAAVAQKRDGTNGTNLESEVYNGLIDGACALDTALNEQDAEEIDVHSVDALSSLIGDMDRAMQEVLAYSAGHEAYEMAEVLEASEVDTAEAFVKAAELTPYFIPVERIMLDRGGDSADRAAEIRGYLDMMPVSDPESLDVTDTAWIDEIGDAPSRIVELLEEEFEIDIKG